MKEQGTACDRTKSVAYYLGIDGGGSKTACSVGDEDSQLSTASAGPCNITRVGEARARESLQQAIRESCAAAGIDPRQIERASAGISGAGRDEVAAIVRNIIAEIVPGEIEVVGDMPIALEAAFGAGSGVVVIAGTGSIAYGRDARGRTARAGGWGFAISDEGSAHWIGRTAVSALVRAIDEGVEHGKDTPDAVRSLPLLRDVTAVWKLHSLDEFVRRANSHPDFAALFPATVAAGDAGDDLARRVLTQAGKELAQLAGVVIRRLFGEEHGLPSIPLAMAGGVFRHSSVVRQVFSDEIHNLHSNVVPNSQIVEPVVGALQMARRGASVQ